ncbi:MAG: hypothetical protein JW702_02480 [Clostridiales bacterium]|nr:hypothetical protein [Clostridiales bacterium]
MSSYALFLILNDVSKLSEIHKIFYEVGCGATTLDSVGMGKVLLDNNIEVPIFSGIRKLVEGNKPYSKTIVSVIRSEEKLRKAIDRIKIELQMDTVNKKGVGFIFVLPVLECHGFKLEDEE